MFLGVIIYVSKIKNSLTFSNSVHGEVIIIKLPIVGPSLLFIEKNFKYDFTSRKNVFFSKKKIMLTNFINYRTKFISHSKMMEINFYKIIIGFFFGKLKFNIFNKKKLKKLKKKFKY